MVVKSSKFKKTIWLINWSLFEGPNNYTYLSSGRVFDLQTRDYWIKYHWEFGFFFLLEVVQKSLIPTLSTLSYLKKV